MAPSNSKISLKLLIDNKAKKVLFAEAGKEFVDFVFSLLTLPIGAVAKLVSAGTMVGGSVGRLNESVYRMGAPYMQPGADKSDGGREQLQQLLARFMLYTCPRRCVTMTMDAGADCPQCRQPMAEEMAYVLPSSAAPKDGGAARPSAASDERGGYVRGGLVTYMVTDGLEVTPMSAISSVTLIHRFCAGKDDVDLAEKCVAVGMEEGLALLKAALRSDVFLARKK